MGLSEQSSCWQERCHRITGWMTLPVGSNGYTASTRVSTSSVSSAPCCSAATIGAGVRQAGLLASADCLSSQDSELGRWRTWRWATSATISRWSHRGSLPGTWPLYSVKESHGGLRHDVTVCCYCQDDEEHKEQQDDQSRPLPPRRSCENPFSHAHPGESVPPARRKGFRQESGREAVLGLAGAAASSAASAGVGS